MKRLHDNDAGPPQTCRIHGVALAMDNQEVSLVRVKLQGCSLLNLKCEH